MHRLVVDQDKCCGCGNCDFLHSDLALGRFYLGVPLLRDTGSMMISPDNLDKYHALIDRALDQCHMDALTLEEV